jgi:acyl dehydratase
MSLPLDTLGARPPRAVTVDPDRVLAYAAATNDDNPAYLSGLYAPPVFGVVPAWDPLITAVFDVVPPDKKPVMLHAGHDMRFMAPLVPGTTLSTTAEPFSVRPSRAGTWVTVRAVSIDADTGQPVLEQFGTMFVRSWADVEPSGPERPDHSFPAAGRAEPVAVVAGVVDADQTWRYAAASGDDNRIHVDDEFARGVGLPGIILHGLCTMAMCGRAVIEGVAGGDPTRLARLAVRFSKPVLPASDLITTIYPIAGDGGDPAYAFEATSRDERVIRDGRAELR